MRKQRRRSASNNWKADQSLCFRYTVQFLYFMNPKFPAFNHLLCLYSRVCVGPGRNPCTGSYVIFLSVFISAPNRVPPLPSEDGTGEPSNGGGMWLCLQGLRYCFVVFELLIVSILKRKKVTKHYIIFAYCVRYLFLVHFAKANSS